MTAAVTNDAVERKSFAWLYQELCPDRHALGQYFLLGRARLAGSYQSRGKRRKIHERGDRPARSANAPRFERKRHGKEERYRGGFEPFADGRRTCDCDYHQ